MAIQRTHPRVFTTRFGPVRIWRDELSELVDVIRQVHPAGVLEVDEFTCDQIDDLAELEEARISRFALKSDDGLVSLLLDRDAAQVSVVEPDLLTRGMLVEVERIAKRHERSSTRWMILSPLPTVVAVVVLLAGSNFLPDSWLGGVLGFLLVFGSAVGATVFVRKFARPRPMAILYTRTRADAPTWLQRNRDALITNVIVSAIFLVIGLLIGLAN